MQKSSINPPRLPGLFRVSAKAHSHSVHARLVGKRVVTTLNPDLATYIPADKLADAKRLVRARQLKLLFDTCQLIWDHMAGVSRSVYGSFNNYKADYFRNSGKLHISHRRRPHNCVSFVPMQTGLVISFQTR